MAEQASAKSAADAKTAAEQAAAVRAELQSKQSKLQLEIAVVKSQYVALTPTQREALAAMPPAPPVAAPAPAPSGGPAIRPPPAAIPARPGRVRPRRLPCPRPRWHSAGRHRTSASGGGYSAAVIQAALSRIGSPYSWGGSGPERVSTAPGW